MEIELAWCAGFLDGEGSFGTYKENTKRAGWRLRIQAAQVSRDPLDRLQQTLGGSVRGPYGPYASTKKAYYQWAIWSEDAVKAVDRLLPYLCSVKQEQARLALEKWYEQG